MVKEIKYVSIKEIVSRILRHPLLKDFSLEQAAQYVSDFIEINGFPDLFEDKEDTITIHNYKGKLPCDCIQINQVKDLKTGRCFRAMQDTFFPNPKTYKDGNEELAFKTQGNIIYISRKEREILLSYKSIPVDKDGYPLLIDNGIYLKALELFIKKELFLILFETGKISAAVIQNVQQDYAYRAGQLKSEFTIPNVSEMESIARMWTAMIPRTTSFDNGFKDNANREYRKIH
jgi:hypothetical protein